MKRMIILVGIIMSLSLSSWAEDIIRMPVIDFNTADGWDYVFDIKTNKFDSVTLDCQSLANSMTFSNNGIVKNRVPFDMFTCEQMVSFLEQSKREDLPVCMSLDANNKELMISRETAEECI